MKEELELKIANLQMEKDKIGQELTKEEIENSLKELEGLEEIDIVGSTIDGEYKDFSFEIDEENRVSVSEKIRGEKPEGEAIVANLTNELDVVPISVWGKLNGGTVTIESLDGLIEEENSTDSNKTYNVTENKTYTFRIIGSNGRKIKRTVKVTNAVPLREDLLTAIKEINDNVVTKVQIKGKVSSEAEYEIVKYSLHVIYHEGDLVLGSDASKGISSNLVLEGNTWILRK